MHQPVCTLLCKRDLPMAMVTLPRIVKFLSQEQTLFVFDDGSFDDSTIAQVQSISSQIKIITLAMRQEAVSSQLSNYPNCLQYRKDFAFAFKLLDIPLVMANTVSRFTYTDADIIYLKNCEPYFNRDVNTYLMTDAVKLSIKLKDVFFKYKWDVPYRFNAGYLCYDVKDFDLDFIEYYLGLPDVRNIPWVSEQTCWALLFARAGKSYTPLTNQFVCRENFTGPQHDTLAIHLIAKLKDKCQPWSEYDLNLIDDIQPGFQPSRNVNFFDWAEKTMKRFKLI